MDLWKTVACGLSFLVEITQRNNDIKKKKKKKKKKKEEAKLP